MNDTYFRNFRSLPNSNEPVRWQRTKPLADGLTGIPAAQKQDKHEISTEKKTAPEKQSVFGYVFENSPQTLAVKMPGDVVPVSFGSHTVLSGLLHDAGSPDIKVTETGIYEIGYSVVLQAANAAHAALSLQADGKIIEGSLTARLISTQESVYSATVLTELKAGTTVRLVITSGTALCTQLAGSGVCASMVIKKLT